MNFNFIEDFKNYPTLDLLKISKRPADYQAAAVEAARLILSTRDVSLQELEEVDQYFRLIDQEEKAKKEMILVYKEKVTSFIEPIILPEEQLKPSKWLKVLLLVIAVQYIWRLFYIIPGIFRLFSYSRFYFDLFLFFLVELAYHPTIFLLLLRKKRWGWILLFAANVFAGVLLISEIIQGIYYLHWPGRDSFHILLLITLRSLYLYFLLKDEITSYFNVGKQIKERSFMAGFLGALIFMAIVQYLY